MDLQMSASPNTTWMAGSVVHDGGHVKSGSIRVSVSGARAGISGWRKGFGGGEFRMVLSEFATGVTVVTAATCAPGHPVQGMTVNAFMSVSLDPPLVVVSLAKGARTGGVIAKARRFGISILREDQHSVARRFAGMEPADRRSMEFEWIDRVPLIPDCLASVVCALAESHDAGDHVLHIGSVEAIRLAQGRPLLFHGGSFGALGHSVEPVAY